MILHPWISIERVSIFQVSRPYHTNIPTKELGMSERTSRGVWPIRNAIQTRTDGQQMHFCEPGWKYNAVEPPRWRLDDSLLASSSVIPQNKSKALFQITMQESFSCRIPAYHFWLNFKYTYMTRAQLSEHESWWSILWRRKSITTVDLTLSKIKLVLDWTDEELRHVWWDCQLCQI
jgi:hypothetical protein